MFGKSKKPHYVYRLIQDASGDWRYRPIEECLSDCGNDHYLGVNDRVPFRRRERTEKNHGHR